MSSCIKISEGVALGIHACAMLAQNSSQSYTVIQMAERLQGSGAHLAKVMQRLSKTGIVKGFRGPQGGFQLARPSSDISLLEILHAIEGEQKPQICVFENPICLAEFCLFNGLIHTLDETFLDYLRVTTLAMIAGKARLNLPAPEGKKTVPSPKKKATR